MGLRKGAGLRKWQGTERVELRMGAELREGSGYGGLETGRSLGSRRS